MPHLRTKRSSKGARRFRIHPCVVGDDNRSGTELRPNGFKLECEVLGSPRAIVAVQVDRGEAIDESRENVLAPSLSQVPPGFQSGGYRPPGILATWNAPGKLPSSPLRCFLILRQVIGRERTWGVSLETHKDIGQEQAGGDAGLKGVGGGGLPRNELQFKRRGQIR